MARQTFVQEGVVGAEEIERAAILADDALEEHRRLAIEGPPKIVVEVKEQFRDSRKLGVKTVIGMDKREKLEAYAQGMGSDTFLDPDEAFSRAAGVKAVPSWLVLDAQGKVVKKVAGAYPSAESQLQELGLDPVSLVQVR